MLAGAWRWQTPDHTVRVLLIEDVKLADRTAEYLQGHGAEVEIIADGAAGLERARAGEHEIVLLDLMLPGMDGLALCQQLRQSSDVPIIMLTARGEEVDRIVGLELGADDYMPKPFSPRELLARMRAVLRRGGPPAPGEPAQLIEFGALVIDRDRHTASFEGHAIELTAFQFDLLWVLARSAGKVLPREQIYNDVRRLRGEPPVDFDPAVDRSVDVHMSKIRAALGAASPSGTTLVRTIRGVGYVLGGGDDG
ncbi:MAG: response regulator transcription factor [Deltaproteobacteria bacterium]|nr:response regulator transcription factor [Deltaproteobacteria bacterium]